MFWHLPAMVAERRRIQSTRTVTHRELERLILPAPVPTPRQAA